MLLAQCASNHRHGDLWLQTLNERVPNFMTSARKLKTPKTTPKNHPWRGLIFTGYPPGIYELDGKPYCPSSWIIAYHGTSPVNAKGTMAVQNSKQECEALVKSWGAKIEWREIAPEMVDAITECNPPRPTPKKKRAPSPLEMLSAAYENHRGLRLSPSEVQILVQSDNALQSLIEEWSK